MNLFQRDFNLQWDQLNDLFNHLTEDSNIELDFARFKDFIKCLWHNKLTSEGENSPIQVLQVEFDFIFKNVQEIYQTYSSADLKKVIFNKTKHENDKNLSEFDEDLIDKLFTRIEYCQIQAKSAEFFLSMLQLVEHRNKQETILSTSNNERQLSISTTDKPKDFASIRDKQISNIKQLINLCTNVRNNENSEIIKKIQIEIMNFGESSHKSFDDIGKILSNKDHYIGFLDVQINEHKTEETKLQEKLEELIHQMSDLKITNGLVKRNK